MTLEFEGTRFWHKNKIHGLDRRETKRAGSLPRGVTSPFFGSLEEQRMDRQYEVVSR